jgi:pyruvate formate lyase activating enzyme
MGMKNGLRYVYTGNVHDNAGESTYCHTCGKKLIGRDWFELTEWNLNSKGACKFCNTPCAGVFEEKPGNWGSKRLPIRINKGKFLT